MHLAEGTVFGAKSTVGDRALISGYGAAGLGVNTGERASIGEEAVIGPDCRFLYKVTIGAGATVGSRVALPSDARVEPGAVVNDESLVMFRATVRKDGPLPAGHVQNRDGTVGAMSDAVERGVDLEKGGPPRVDFARAVKVIVMLMRTICIEAPRLSGFFASSADRIPMPDRMHRRLACRDRLMVSSVISTPKTLHRARRLGHALVAAENTQGSGADRYIRREAAEAGRGSRRNGLRPSVVAPRRTPFRNRRSSHGRTVGGPQSLPIG